MARVSASVNFHLLLSFFAAFYIRINIRKSYRPVRCGSGSFARERNQTGP
ncbi:MAG: hypothetical protein ACOYVF_11900 [Candidatus Zixiibacteriota bacterium]